MFDVSFGELLVIAVVALVVIGPERLPKVARTMGLLAGRVQRYVSSVKSDIERELRMEELQKIQQDVRREVSAVETELGAEARQVEQAADQIAADVRQSAAAEPTQKPDA